MAPGTHAHPHVGVKKGEASSTMCSPKPDSALSEVSSSLAALPIQETDSDPNVTSTTGTDHKKKQEANRDICTMKKELDSLTSLKDKPRPAVVLPRAKLSDLALSEVSSSLAV